MFYAAPRRCPTRARDKRRWAAMRPRETLCIRRCTGAFRAAPHRTGGARNAAPRQRRFDRAAGRTDLRAACARAHAVVSAGAGALPGFDRAF